MSLLKIENLHVKLADEDVEILKGINLEIKAGETHAIMGPNGSGKSTLANVIMGNPKYSIASGKIIFNGEVINEMSIDERANKGLFLSFQHPPEINGIKLRNFLFTTKQKDNQASMIEMNKEVESVIKNMNMSSDFLNRYLNVGFSGGEKKKNEVMQLAFLKKKMAILDEIDSGLDVDALKDIAAIVNEYRNNNSGLLLITHYKRILEYIVPENVHILISGRIINSGGKELAEQVEETGYAFARTESGE
ncbi:MAG: Fe-S cluster assembly ATPase SufC [Kosmotogaceae bacterium]